MASKKSAKRRGTMLFFLQAHPSNYFSKHRCRVWEVCRESGKSWDLGKSNQRTIWACIPCKWNFHARGCLSSSWTLFLGILGVSRQELCKYSKKTWVSCCCQNWMSLIYFHQTEFSKEGYMEHKSTAMCCNLLLPSQPFLVKDLSHALE